jgi:N-acetyl sugar amidotransferase
MRYCSRCVMPDTRPDLRFDDHGTCDACRSFERKFDGIDWDERKREFEDLLATHGNRNSSKYDCLVPVSGGKDSHLTLHIVKEVYGLNPLCLCFEPTLPTEIGRTNLANISRLGVDVIHFKQNPIVYKKLVMEGFKRVGDMEWANHMGIWSVPVHFAIKFDVPFIFWGESPQLEYGGAETVSEANKRQFDEDWLNDYGCLNGLRPQDMVDEEAGISLDDLKMYIYPSRDDVAKWGGRGIFVGYYFKWNNRENLETIERMGFKRRGGRIEVSYTDHEKLDCLSMNLHDYLKYLKYGYGRATDAAAIDIRNGEISREEGVRLVEAYDGRYPKYCVEAFCSSFGITMAEFDSICEPFVNRALFETKEGVLRRDADGSYVMRRKFVERRRNSVVAV